MTTTTTTMGITTTMTTTTTTTTVTTKTTTAATKTTLTTSITSRNGIIWDQTSRLPGSGVDAAAAAAKSGAQNFEPITLSYLNDETTILKGPNFILTLCSITPENAPAVKLRLEIVAFLSALKYDHNKHLMVANTKEMK